MSEAHGYHDIHVQVSHYLFLEWQSIAQYHGRRAHELRIAVKKIIADIKREEQEKAERGNSGPRS